jgi:DNA-binding PadR family transcriptional regulator
MTDLIILGLLLPSPKHGYQLKREAGILLSQESLHNNLVYPLLRRFVTRRWVRRRTAPGQRGQTKHLYSLTALGREQLIDKLSTFTDQDARSAESFRFRVGMFWLLRPEARHRIMDARETFLRSRLAILTNVEASFQLNRYAGEVTERMRAEAKSELAWISHLRTLDDSRKDKCP